MNLNRTRMMLGMTVAIGLCGSGALAGDNLEDKHSELESSFDGAAGDPAPKGNFRVYSGSDEISGLIRSQETIQAIKDLKEVRHSVEAAPVGSYAQPVDPYAEALRQEGHRFVLGASLAGTVGVGLVLVGAFLFKAAPIVSFVWLLAGLIFIGFAIYYAYQAHRHYQASRVVDGVLPPSALGGPP